MIKQEAINSGGTVATAINSGGTVATIEWPDVATSDFHWAYQCIPYQQFWPVSTLERRRVRALERIADALEAREKRRARQ